MPNRNPGVITQDWEPLIIHKTKKKASELKDSKAVNAAMRTGAQVQTVKAQIQKTGMDKKMSQAKLTKLINERPQVIQEYEREKAVPTRWFCQDGEGFGCQA
ncbi:hypothetical protein AMTRI_Chr11g149980 [Amborella trichopoda]